MKTTVRSVHAVVIGCMVVAGVRSSCLPEGIGISLQVSGGVTSLYSAESGRLAFGVGEIGATKRAGGAFGKVVEKVWNEYDTETLVWTDTTGKLIANFERVEHSKRPWSTGDYDDFSNVRVTDCEDGKPLFYIQYFPGPGYFAGKSWFDQDPGHYRVLSYADTTDGGALSVGISNESNTKWGGGRQYKLNIMEEKSTTCVDKDPDLCFHALASNMCLSSINEIKTDLLLEGDTCGLSKWDASKGVAASTCCEMSCAYATKDLEKCHPSWADAVEDSPVATMKSKSRHPYYNYVQDWQITVERSAPSTDPRVLVALATMKTSGAKIRDGADRRRRRGVSPAVDHREVIWLFGSYAGYQVFALGMFALVCLFLCVMRGVEVRNERRPVGHI